LGLDARVTNERVSTGIPDLDAMLEDKGYYKGSSVLITGQAGTGKSSFGVKFLEGVCQTGKKALLITFEESPSQIIRNMRSIGMDLEPFLESGLLKIYADRPTSYGLEMHLVNLIKIVNEFKPEAVVLDPISSLMVIGEEVEVRSTLVRMVDFLKMKNITTIFTDLKHSERPEKSSMVSSLVDAWILLEDVEANGEHNRILRLVKSRGMAHSNQIREFHLTANGVTLVAPYIGPSGVLTGSARFAQEAVEKAEEAARAEEIAWLRQNLEQQKKVLDVQIESIKAEYDDKRADLERKVLDEERRKKAIENSRKHLSSMRTGSGKAGNE
jgi:circadian clock protein KaiC